MAHYAFPQSLFPSSDQVAQRYMQGEWPPFAQELRTQAFAGYAKLPDHDKELTRFLVPSVGWSDLVQSSSSWKQLGEHSWIGTLDKAPFIPAVCTQLLEVFSKEPCSLLHLLGATFDRIRLLYAAESLSLIELDDSFEGREVLLVVVEKDVSITIKDALRHKKFSARALIGHIASHAQVTWIYDYDTPTVVEHDRWHLEQGACLKEIQVLTSNHSWIRKEYLIGSSASLLYTYLSVLHNEAQAALSTVQKHIGSASESNVHVKTIGTGRSKSFYRGVISVQPEAIGSRARQQQKALLMSTDAKTCAIPSLEVATNDVHCSHGSAVGQCNKDELLYLMGRGLSSEQARHLLLEGFLREAVCEEYPELTARLMRSVYL
jgi:hypothetical protein